MKHQLADSSLDAGFAPTHPPLLPRQAQLAELMSMLGASTIRAVIFDLETRLCHESWQINEFGESSNDGDDGDTINPFVTAMGTIAQLGQTPNSDTLVRQLNPRRCAFAWHIDERRMAVAEARYWLPQTGRRDQDAPLLRELFLARTHGPGPDGAPPGLGPAPLSPTTADGHEPVAGHLAAGGPRPPSLTGAQGATDQEGTSGSASTGRTAGLFAMILFGLAAAAVFLITDQRMQSLQGEQRRLQARAEATVSRQLASVLARGDYGEVQAELDTFAELGYFQDAVVTNAQRRVIALVGSVQDARIGNIMTADTSGTAKVVALRDPGQQGAGQWVTWAAPASIVEPLASPRALLMVALLLSLGALAVAAWVLVLHKAGAGGRGVSSSQAGPAQRFGSRTSA